MSGQNAAIDIRLRKLRQRIRCVSSHHHGSNASGPHRGIAVRISREPSLSDAAWFEREDSIHVSGLLPFRHLRKVGACNAIQLKWKGVSFYLSKRIGDMVKRVIASRNRTMSAGISRSQMKNPHTPSEVRAKLTALIGDPKVEVKLVADVASDSGENDKSISLRR